MRSLRFSHLPKFFCVAAIFTCLPLRAEVTTAPSSAFQSDEKIEELNGKIHQLEADVKRLQGENDDLKKQLADLHAAEPVPPTPIDPLDMFKDYDQDKMPKYGDPSNAIRMHGLNEWMVSQWKDKRIAITGKFDSATNASGGANPTLVLKLTNYVPPALNFAKKTSSSTQPAELPPKVRWIAEVTVPGTETDAILAIQKGATITVSGVAAKVTFATGAKMNILSLSLKPGVIGTKLPASPTTPPPAQ